MRERRIFGGCESFAKFLPFKKRKPYPNLKTNVSWSYGHPSWQIRKIVTWRFVFGHDQLRRSGFSFCSGEYLSAMSNETRKRKAKRNWTSIESWPSFPNSPSKQASQTETTVHRCPSGSNPSIPAMYGSWGPHHHPTTEGREWKGLEPHDFNQNAIHAHLNPKNRP